MPSRAMPATPLGSHCRGVDRAEAIHDPLVLGVGHGIRQDIPTAEIGGWNSAGFRRCGIGTRLSAKAGWQPSSRVSWMAAFRPTRIWYLPKRLETPPPTISRMAFMSPELSERL